jgi:hypothetical protein
MAPFIKYTIKEELADGEVIEFGFINAECITRAVYIKSKSLLNVFTAEPIVGKSETAAITIKGKEAEDALEILRNL